MLARIIALACLGFTATPAVAQRIWVVDSQGGIGVDATEIQTAIDQAAANDVIRVRAGVYAQGLRITKGLRILGEPGVEIQAAQPFVVQDLIAGDVVLALHLHCREASGPMRAIDCAGSIHFDSVCAHGGLRAENCQLLSARSSTFAGIGCHFDGCAAVSWSDCKIQTSDHTALHVERSMVVVAGGQLESRGTTAIRLASGELTLTPTNAGTVRGEPAIHATGGTLRRDPGLTITGEEQIDVSVAVRRETTAALSTGPARVGSDWNAELFATPGARAMTFAFLPSPPIAVSNIGLLWVALPAIVFDDGVIGPSGQRSMVGRIPASAPRCVVLSMQSAVFGPAGVELSAPSMAVVD